ncbi:MAG: hypothetical protein IIA87_02680 [Nanoarchaeota archaeon]|nr:hypothetical protein [Nanoarchaeota archaeon]
MKQFVYPATSTGEVFRELTRENNLQIERHPSSQVVTGLYYKLKKIPDRIVHALFNPPPEDPLLTWEDDEKLRFFHFKGGMNLCEWDERHGFRLSPPYYHSKSIVAGEPILFGIGVLRKARREQTTGEAMFGLAPAPKIISEFVEIYGSHTIRNKDNGIVRNDAWESTNIILGDSYGELEQLIRRRQDEEFLEVYLSEIQNMTKPVQARYRDPSHNHVFLNGLGLAHKNPAFPWRVMHEKHRLSQQIWEEPPNTTYELIERVDFLLKNTFVDINGIEARIEYEHQCLIEGIIERRHRNKDGIDISGYDGWLQIE